MTSFMVTAKMAVIFVLAVLINGLIAEKRQLSGSGSLDLGSVGTFGLNVQNGQVSGSANVNLPGGSNVNVGVDPNGQVSGSANVQLPGGSSVSGAVQNGQVSGSANINLPGGSNVNVGVDPNGQVSGSANVQLPGGSSVSGAVQNGQVSGSANINLPGGSNVNVGVDPNGQVSGSANINLPGGSSVNANLQNGQLSGGANINLGNGGSVNANLQNGQFSAGMNLPGSGSGSTGGSGTGFNAMTFVQQAGLDQFNQFAQSLGSMGSMNFQPGGLGGGMPNFSPGQLPGMGSLDGSGTSGSSTGTSGTGGSGNSGSGTSFGSGSGSSFGSGSGTSFGSGSGSSLGSGSGSSFGPGSGTSFGSGSGSSLGSGSGTSFGSGSGSSFGSGGGTSFGSGSGSNFGSGSGSSTGSGTGPNAGAMSGSSFTSGSGSTGQSTGSPSGSGGQSTGNPSGFTGHITGSPSGQSSSAACSPSAGISSQNPTSGSCLCVTASDVIVHSSGSLSGSKIGTLSSPTCVTYTGSKITPCLHDPSTQDKHAWFRISHNGQTGWMAGDYLSVGDKSKCSSGGSTNNNGATSSSSGSGSSSASSSQQPASSGSLSDCFPGQEMQQLMLKIRNYESLKNKAYDAQPASSYVDWTVCVGFNLKRSNARQVFASALPGVSFDAVYNGQTLTDDQCMKLFAYDLNANYVSQPKNRFGASFCKLPVNVKIAIVNAYYRGDMGPKTEGLIASGDWCHVKAEYLNHGDYINCHSRGIPGVCTRMDWNAAQFQTMCNGGSSQTSSSSGSSSQTSGSGSCSPVAKEYACKILQLHNQGKINLWDAHSSKVPDNAYAINNIQDTCNGKAAARSSYSCNECSQGPAPGGTHCINPQILKYIYDLGSRGSEKVLINEITGACHGCNSYHYYGEAVDIQTSNTRNGDYMDTCRRFGGSPLDEHHHIHCTIKS